MSRIEVPLAYKTLRTTGDVVLRAELSLELKSDHRTWVTIRFLVDPGTEMTTTPASDARKRGLPIPKRPVPGLTFQGHEVRSGLLPARIVAMDATAYHFPCYFLGDPNGPSMGFRNLLGLTGVINQIGLGFDGSPTVVGRSALAIVSKLTDENPTVTDFAYLQAAAHTEIGILLPGF